MKCHGLVTEKLINCTNEAVVVDHNLDQSYPCDAYYCAECWGDFPHTSELQDGRKIWEPVGN